MFFKKQEKKRLNPWCVMIIGGLAIAGAVSLTNKGKSFITERGRAIASFFGGRGCACESQSSEEA